MTSVDVEIEIQSKNVRVAYQEGVGRCLLATRDIEGEDSVKIIFYVLNSILAGEEVLVDFPAMIAPYHDPQPMCVECLCK